MKILITGNKGFIGSKLQDALKRSHEVIGIDKKDNANLLFCNYFPQVDLVYHLAAQTDVTTSVRHPLEDAQDNILATIKLAQAYSSKRIIYASSAATLNIQSPYGLSKAVGAEYLKLLTGDAVICLFPNLFGQGGKGVIERFIQDNPITIYGDGSQTRDFVHVNDIVRGLIQAASWQSGEYQLGSNTSIPIIELAQATKKPITFKPQRNGEILESRVLNTTPDWKPLTDPITYIQQYSKI